MTGDTFVGRQGEVERANAILDQALGGHGGLLLFAGEPGIGKTRIAHEVAALAGGRGAKIVWGRAWEAGGAPPYWPWMQVFEALGGDDPFAASDDDVSDPRELRFRSFEIVAKRLRQLATTVPLAIVLDDLHAADKPSLHLLHLLARTVRGVPMLIIGTYRLAEARLSEELGALLGKIGREGTVIELERLSSAEVLGWIRNAAPGITDEAVRRVYAASEGNPLFLHELIRAGAPIDGRVLPIGLRALLDEQLGRVSPQARAFLQVASVFGREFELSEASALAEADADSVEAHLVEGMDAGVVERRGSRYVFDHILLRERLYGAIPASRRAALHWAIGQRVLARSADTASAAHHLLEGASTGDRIHAARVTREAAASMMARFAFEEIGGLCSRAIEVLGPAATGDAATLACELEISWAEALIAAGESAAGKRLAVNAAGSARRIDRPLLEARAALVYGTEVSSGSRDPTMLRLLRDALERLEPADGTVRARTMARLSAAMTPPENAEAVEELDRLGREAVAMARRLDDQETLLFCLRFHTLSYLPPHDERYRDLAEAVALATRLDRRLVLMNVMPWWFATLRERGNQAEAELAFATCDELGREFQQPHHQFRLLMLRATRAILAGDLDLGERLGIELGGLAERSELPAARMAWANHRIGLAHARGEPSSIAPDAERVIATLAPFDRAAMWVAWVLAATGQHDRARDMLRAATFVTRSVPTAVMAGQATVLCSDAEVAAPIFDLLERCRRAMPMFWGLPAASMAFGPTARIAAGLAAMLGKTEKARALYDEAIELSERMGTPAFAELARRERATLGDARARRPTNPPPRGDSIHIVRQGDVWEISSFTGLTLRLKDSKGLQYLARLTETAGKLIHAAELADLEEAGDGGVALDTKAKHAYRERLDDLASELDQARRFNDVGRIERLEAELEAISDQLVAAVGLGGRDRKMGSLAERARINVQRRLRHALDAIGEQDPALQRYLAAAIKTGHWCSFTPV